MKAKIVDATVARTQNGKLQVEIAVICEDQSPHSVFQSLEGGALKYSLSTLKALGLVDGQEPSSLAGKDCEIELYTEEYNGKTSHKAKFINLFVPTVGLRTKPELRLSADEAKAILWETDEGLPF